MGLASGTRQHRPAGGRSALAGGHARGHSSAPRAALPRLHTREKGRLPTARPLPVTWPRHLHTPPAPAPPMVSSPRGPVSDFCQGCSLLSAAGAHRPAAQPPHGRCPPTVDLTKSRACPCCSCPLSLAPAARVEQDRGPGLSWGPSTHPGQVAVGKRSRLLRWPGRLLVACCRASCGSGSRLSPQQQEGACLAPGPRRRDRRPPSQVPVLGWQDRQDCALNTLVLDGKAGPACGAGRPGWGRSLRRCWPPPPRTPGRLRAP